MGHVQVGRSPRGLYPVDDAADLQPVALAGKEDIAGMEVPVQEAGPVVRGLAADHVHGPLPQLRPLGVFGRAHPLGRGPRLIGTRPCLCGHWQPVDAQQLVGQQFGTLVGALIAQAHGPRQQGHQQGRMVAVLCCRVRGHQPGRGDIRAAEEAQNCCLAGQQALSVANVEGLDEDRRTSDRRPPGPQMSRRRISDVQPPRNRATSSMRSVSVSPFSTQARVAPQPWSSRSLPVCSVPLPATMGAGYSIIRQMPWSPPVANFQITQVFVVAG